MTLVPGKSGKTRTLYCAAIVALVVSIQSVALTANAAETLVNTETVDNQNYPAIGMDADGNFVITWHSNLQDGSGYGIFAQRFSAAEVPQGLEFQVNSYTSNAQGNATVAMAPNGDFTVVWQSQGQDAGVAWGVYAQRYFADGSTDGAEFRVNSEFPQDQAMPSAAMDSQGNLVVVFQGYGSSDSYGIHGRLYDSSGTALSTAFLVHDVTADIESAPSVARAPDGNWIVVWERDNGDGDGKGVFGRRFDSTGAALGVEFPVNTNTVSDQENPHVAIDQSGNFIVVWEDLGADGDLEGVFAQRYTAAGATDGTEFQVNTTTALDQRNPVVGMNPGGNFIVMWESDGQDGDGFGIFGREYNYTGVPFGNDFQINTTATGVQAVGNNSMVGDNTGRWIAGWYGQGSGDSEGVFYDTLTSVLRADLQVSLSVSEASPDEGDAISYTVTLTNAGPSVATGIVVGHALSSGITYVSNTPSDGTYNQGDGTWQLPSLMMGATATLTLNGTVDAGTAGDMISATAAITAVNQADPISINNSDSVDINVVAANLALTKTVNDPTPGEGATVVYTLTASNNGPDNGTGIVVTDLLPTGVTFVSSTPSQGSYVSGTGLWTVGPIADGAAATLGITCTVDAGTRGTTITNNASISAADQIDPVAPNNTASRDIVVQSADLQLAKTVNVAAPNEGDSVTYTVTVTNAGPSSASAVAVADTLPAGLTYGFAVPSQGGYNPATGIWTVGEIAMGTDATLDLICTVNGGTSGATIINTASISAANPTDPAPANNTDSASITIQAADLQISQMVDDANPRAGDTIQFVLSVANAGPEDATGVAVADTLPAGLTFVSSVPSEGSYDPVTGLWTIGNLLNGTGATLDINCTVDTAAGGSLLVNRARIAAVSPIDAIPSNDIDSVAVTVQAADLQMSKIVDEPDPDEGETIVYTVTLTNAGPDDAAVVAVADTLPTGFTFVSDVPSQGTFDPVTSLWTVGTVANGTSATLDITGTIDSGTGGSTIINTARVASSDQADVIAGNNFDSASLAVPAADLQISKTVNEAAPEENDTVVYTITLANVGPDDASSIAVADTLPGGVTFVSSAASQGAYDEVTGLWAVGAVADGAFATLDITCTVDEGAGGSTIENTVQVSAADQADPLLANDADTATLTVAVARGSVGLVNIPLDADRINPGGPAKSALKIQVTNLSTRPDTLRGLTIANTTGGPGSPTDLDANWAELSLWIEIDGSLVAPDAIPATVLEGTFNTGLLSFTDLAIALPQGQDVVLVVQGRASLSSRDGDPLSVSIPDTTALSFILPADIQADWPIETINALVIDGLMADQIVMNEVGAGLFPQDSSRNLVLDFLVPPNGYSIDELQRLNVVNLGNATYGEDITNLEGWADDTDGTFDPDLDTPLGSFAFTGARWELTGLAQSIPESGLRIFISVDISADANEGRSLQMALPTLPDVGIGTASGNDGPLDRVLANSYSQAISASNRVLITSWAIDRATAYPGQVDVPLIHLVATNTYGDERSLSTLTVTNGSSGAAAFGSAALDGELATLNLRMDGNGDGVLGSLIEDPVLGGGNFRDGSLTVSGLTWTLAAGATRHLFLTGDISLTGSKDHDVLSAFINSGSDLDFATPTAVSANWPVTSGSAWTVNGMVAAQVGNFPVPNQALAAGEGPALALDISIPRNGYQNDTLVGLTVVNLGTAAAADLAALDLYLDGGDGLFTPGSGDDIGLGPLVPVADAWSSPILNEMIPASGLRVFAGMTVAANPTDSATLQLAVPLNGITVASGNTGPLDQTIASSGTALLSTAPLLANMEFAVDQSTIGQELTARMILRNVGADNLVDISPTLPVASGAGAVLLVDGPVPATIDLAVGAADTITWTYAASAAGTVTLAAAAEGLTEVSSQVRTSLSGSTSDHRILVPATQLNVYSVTNMPFTLNRGQENVVPLTLTFLLPEVEHSSTVTLSRLRLRLRDSDGLGIVPADLLNRIVVSEGIVTYLEKTDLETSGDEIVLDLTTPLHVAGGEPVSVAVRLDISSTTNVVDFLVSIDDPSWFTVHDAVGGAPVPTVLQAGTYPIESVVGTIVFEATGLEITAVAGSDESIGVGQHGVGLISLDLYNPGLSELGSNVLVNVLSFSLQDDSGAVLANPEEVLAGVRVAVADDVLLTVAPTAQASSSIELELPSALTIPVNTRVLVNIIGDLGESAPTGPIRFVLDEPASIVARDGNSGEPVLASFSPAEILGPSLTIEERADQLMARSEALLPSTLVVGAHDAPAFSLDLRHPGDPEVASIQVDSLRVACRDDDRQLISPAALIDKLELWADGVQVSVIHDPAGVGFISLPLSDLQISSGQTVAMELRVDFEPNAVPSNLELVLDGSNVFARDLNLGTNVELIPESGQEFPLTSGLTRLQIPAEELTVRFEDVMPAVLVGADGEIPVAGLTLANPAGSETSSITVESLTVRASNEAFASRPIGSWLEEAILYRDNEIWGSVELDAAADTVAVIVPDQPSELFAGEALNLELRIVARSAPARSGLRLGISEDAVSVRQPGGGLSAIRIEPLDGVRFPFWTAVGNFSAATLADSYSNFPNPFAAGRESTTFVVQLPAEATVSLRVMTAHWRPIATIVDQELRSAGLYQDDRWDGLNGHGVPVQSGVYVAELVVEYPDGTRERHLRKVAVLR
jgi:uncharacterized repeat protein (TIGR01451 family)